MRETSHSHFIALLYNDYLLFKPHQQAVEFHTAAEANRKLNISVCAGHAKHMSQGLRDAFTPQVGRPTMLSVSLILCNCG